MRNGLTRTLGSALLLPLLLFALTATSFAAWRCQSGGAMRSGCCCPGEKAGHAEEGTTLRARACCAVERFEVEKTPSDLSRGQPAASAPEAVVMVSVLAPPAEARRVLPRVSHEGPPGGRDLVLQKRAFLI
jgi:hypothetical protein